MHMTEDNDSGQPQGITPRIITHDELLGILDDIRLRVATGDSFEGSIEWMIPEAPAGARDFAVRASYRIGNSLGQGGMRLVGDMPATPQVPRD